MPTGLSCVSCRAGQEDWLVARYGAPHCADDGPRFIKRAETLLGPATQLSVVLDGDCIWGSEFGDAGVAAGNPAEHVHLLGISQTVSDGIKNDFEQRVGNRGP